MSPKSLAPPKCSSMSGCVAASGDAPASVAAASTRSPITGLDQRGLQRLPAVPRAQSNPQNLRGARLPESSDPPSAPDTHHIVPEPCAKSSEPPTSGTSPMPTSGMAIFDVSPTIPVWTRGSRPPTPPPMVKPCRKLATGLGNSNSRAFIRYSSRQNFLTISIVARQPGAVHLGDIPASAERAALALNQQHLDVGGRPPSRLVRRRCPDTSDGSARFSASGRFSVIRPTAPSRRM